LYRSGKIKSALISLAIFLVFFGTILILGYFLVGVADVPIDIQTAYFIPTSTPIFTDYGSYAQASTWLLYANRTQPFSLSILLFFISILAIFGGLLFVIFGGIGLTYLPIDLIYGYKNRPKPINDQEFKARKILLAERADELLKEGYSYRERRPGRSLMNDWKNEVFMLEEEFDLTMAAHKRDFPVFFYWGMLLVGVLGILLSISWIIHIFVWKIYRFIPFLNDLFYALEGGLVQFFGVVAYCIWSLWLMWAVIKGNFTFGLRIPLLFTIHPMKPEGTLMNGF
jgi:LMBR1 domain-containing protein 1